jgi:hypothetical protein
MPKSPPSSYWNTPSKLNSSEMTAPTVNDASPSGSWTTMDTRSRSERHRSRRAITDTPNSRTTATEPAIRLEVEDDCSSIESTSNHRRPQEASRPAHLSLEETNISIDDSLRSINQTVEPHPRYPMNRQPPRSPARYGIFPKTSPDNRRTAPTRQPQQQPPNLSQPYGMHRSKKSIAPIQPYKQSPNTPSSSSDESKSPAESPLRSHLDRSNAPTEVAMNLSSARRFQLRARWDPQPSATRYPPDGSDAGAPTEIMTNRARDIQLRYHQTPQRPNIKPEVVIHSLMDDSMDSISNASGSVKSSDRDSQQFLAALNNRGTSSVSSPVMATSTRLSRHMMDQKDASDAHHPPSAPDEEDGSFEKSLNSVRGEIGATNNTNMHMNARPPLVFGSRQVTGGPPIKRMHPTIRALQQKPPPPPPQPRHLPHQEQHPTQQHPTQQQQHRPEPAQDENKNIVLPPYEDVHEEGKALSNASSNPFTVSKPQLTRMEGTFSEASSGWTPISFSDQGPNHSQQRDGKSTIMSVFSKDLLNVSPGTQAPNHSQQRNGKPPIMSVFSNDRLDLSFGTQSPIRKMRSYSMTNKEPPEVQGAESIPTLTRSKSSSEVIVRQQHRQQLQQSPERSVDPIFCPGGSMSFASSIRTHNNDTSMSQSQSTVQTKQSDGETEVKRSVIPTWPPPREDESCVESELVEILGNGYERGKGTSKLYGSSIPSPSDQKSTDNQQYRVPNFGPQRWKSTPPSSPPKQEFPISPNDSEGAMWNQMSGRRSQVSEISYADKQRKARGSEKSLASVTSSVRDKIRAFNMGTPDSKSNEAPPSRNTSLHRAAWKPGMDNSFQGNKNFNDGDLTSRQMLIMGAHLACMSNDGADEKKMDDDKASVKSLRESFENPQSTRQHRDIDVYDNDDMSSLRSMFDDDTASVRSLRERFGQNASNLEIYDDDDDDTASIKSLRERFEGALPAKEPAENGISKLRARFEKKPIAARGKIALQRDNSWMDNGYKESQPPMSIVAKNRSRKRTDGVSKSSLPPNAPPSVQAGGAADGGDNAKAEVFAGILDSREGTNIPTITDAKVSSTYPPESLSSEHVGVSEDRDVVNQKNAPVFSPGPADHSRKAVATYPESKSSAIEPDPIFVASPQRINNMGVQRRAIPFGVAKKPSTPPKDRLLPGPISSPFQSMRDRMNSLSKSRSGKPLAPPERRSMPINFSRWASNRREDKLTPLAAQDSKAQINQEKIGGEISQSNSYDLAPVNQPEAEDISQHENAATPSRTDDRSFDEFFSRTNRLLREKKQQEAKSTTTPKHSNRNVQAGSQRISNHPAGDARTSNRKNIFRSESKAGTPEPPESHWTAQADKPTGAKMPESNDKKGHSKESEFSDGVTLDLSIADVSNITDPTAIRSKASKEVDRQPSTSSSTEDILTKKSEASSSQTSEAAAPLIDASTRLLSDDMSGLIGHQNKQRMEKKLDARNDKSSFGIGQEDTRGFGEVGWDIQHVQSSFPFRTPSSENLFDIDPQEGDFSSDWLAFDYNDTAWADAPRGTADGNAGMESKSKPSSRPTTPAAERALRSTEQSNSPYDIFTKPVASTSQPTTAIRPSANPTMASIRPAAVPAMASKNAPTEAHRPKTPTREMISNLTTPPQQAVLSAERAVQPITPTREPEAAFDRHMIFRPASPSREASISNASGHDLQAVTPTFHKSVPTRHMLLRNSQQESPRSRSPYHRSVQSQGSSSLGSKKSHQPIHAREEMTPSLDAMAAQNYIAPDFQQPIRHQTGQPVLSPRNPMGRRLPAVTPSPHRSMSSHHEHTQNQHPSYAHHTPSNMQRQDIQNNTPRTPTRQPLVPASILSTSDPDYATIMEARHQMLLSRQRSLQQRKVARESGAHASSQYPPTSPSTFSAFGESPLPPQYPRTSASNYGMPDPMQTPTGGGFFGRTHPDQAQSLTQSKHPGRSYVPSRLTPPEPPFQHPSNTFESRGPPMNPPIRTFEAQLKPRSTLHHNKRPPWHAQSSPGESFYNQVTTRLGLGSTGESNNAALFAKLSKLKESRMRRSAGRSAPSVHPVEQRQEHQQSMSSGPTMTNSYAWQHHDDTGNRPPRSTVNDLSSPFNRQAAPGSSWPDVVDYGSQDDFSASTKSMNKFFEASLEVD